MYKKYVAIIVWTIVAVGGFFIWQKLTDKTPVRTKSSYTFASLPPEVAAQVEFKNSGFNDGKPFVIPFENVLDEHYKSLNTKKQELLFLAAYEQLIKPNAGANKKSILNIPAPQRKLEEVCTQYGVACENLSDISFVPTQKDFAVVDGQSFSLKDLKQDTVPLLAVKTEILNHVLSRIDEKIRTKLLYALAKEAGQPVQEYIQAKIISATDLAMLSEQELLRVQPDLPKEARKPLLQAMSETKKNEAIDLYLQKNAIELPMKINIDKPKNDFKTRWEWTPYFGEQAGKGIDVILFADFFNDASRTSIRNFLKYQKFDYGATFGFRPYFKKEDQFQWLAAEITMCVWSEQKKVFWQFLERSLFAKKDTVEADFYKAIQDVGGNMESAKRCALSRSMQKVVEYHIQSAQYLKIINTPVVFVGNEVHVGPLSSSDFEKMLLRQRE